jgi:hypothetical protein
MKITPLRIVACIVGLVLFIGAIVVALNWFQARGYDKARQTYEAQDKLKAAESEKLKARAEAAEQRVAELEPKLLAIEAVGDQKKVLDDSLSTKIDATIQEAQHEAAVTDTATDCVTRSQRLCTKFHSLKPPIPIDCPALVAKCGK